MTVTTTTYRSFGNGTAQLSSGNPLSSFDPSPLTCSNDGGTAHNNDDDDIGKAKIHQLPTRFSLRLAALRAHQPIDKARPSFSTPAAPDPIIISSDPEKDLNPKGSSSEEEDPKMDPEGEDQGVNSLDESEEVPEYIPGDGLEENQDAREEEPEEEGPGADHEMDPRIQRNQRKTLKRTQRKIPRWKKRRQKSWKPDEDEYNEYFANYFELAPPSSPDSSVGSRPATDAYVPCHSPFAQRTVQFSSVGRRA
ncbi:hypothetical protein PIB30_078912 [Stylosanthes scabra]|uniref:Uncharacterized protein n=1 Tax=Stylosanthes scabra TaxID=79078 RepID=A0ABU6ZPT1_9FABA|nr:hypothetical protein [Stylosanthes scabra]